ncbi:MAG TPA: molybdate ABC transporter substrate-binding protein [Candidatus Brocadiia bacterium]|nr:molybdate ABC transporter substrate-binding protein [Candidatus Brocadiia bacterium]
MVFGIMRDGLKIMAFLAAVVALSCASCRRQQGPVAAGPLRCYVGGTMRPAMEEIVKHYKQKTGVEVEIDYADSGQLLIRIEQTKQGDLYVCHDPFQAALKNKGLSRDGWTIALVTPMIGVQKGNPKGIKGLKDLGNEGVKVVLTDPQYSTVGHINAVMFRKAGAADAIEKNVITRTKGGGEAANAVGIGAADACIAWDAVLFLRSDKLEILDIEPQFRPDPVVDAVTSATFGPIDMSRAKVTIDTLKCSTQPEKAKAFAEYVASPNGAEVFARFGFTVLAKEQQKAEGPLYLYCGAGIRPAVAEAIDAFQKETGVQVEADYGGSGILISKLRLQKTGDLYMPGENAYIEMAEKDGLIASKKAVFRWTPVILVKKGNPKSIAALEDLAKPGIKLGLGNPETCAIGMTTKQLLEKNAIPQDGIKANLVFSSATVNELGVQIKTGDIDATIVWDAVAAYYSDCSDRIAIPAEKNLPAPVGIGLLKCSKRPELAQKFMDYLTGDKGKAIFKKHHYATEG